MRASAALSAQADAGGRTRLTVVRSQAPLVLRPTADAVYLAAGAGGPLGGDCLELTVAVGPGARLTLRTVAATVALPGPGGRESVLRLVLSVGAGGRLAVLPEPTVVAARARHRLVTTAEVARGGALVLREEVILGRHGEAGGVYYGLSRVDVDGAPLLRHELVLDGADPVSTGSASAVGGRACGGLLLVDPAWATGGPPAGWADAGSAGLPLAGPGLLVTAVADDAPALRALLTGADRPAVGTGLSCSGAPA